MNDEDRRWFVETGTHPNRLVEFEASAKPFTTPTALPSGGGTVRHMVYDAKRGLSRFGTDNHTIGTAPARLNPIS